MKIGIDTDNCISNFDDTLLKEYLKHDKALRNSKIINGDSEYLRKEIYERISKLNKKEYNQKVNVILDTDIYNECDDQFALSYLLKSQDKFNIEAITVAP